ncbi:type II toxin-antitoxin system ParD family antitoxin [Arenibaculum sp.]|jgi:antitoxin ParD1/3/4|uniref:type II toxin-antitoxin system ParD family antitoxin n=1 Tax=Arenibaculum sp. TaxID=2865862 RepID=UPI002E10A072|nr:type II toxin-antitoxin system ParD family antitoxin [Arenibaculum sp.]
MATMNVSLPDPMKDWVEAQTRTGRYSNASDYVRDLIRRDQERAAKLTELQGLIDEGLASGVSSRTTADILREARRRADTATKNEI